MDARPNPGLQHCIVDCLECYSVCKEAAMNHCLEAGGRHLEPEHFRLMNDCAEICGAAANFILSGSAYHAGVCALCAEICEACALSCEGLEDMGECARVCRGCAHSCRSVAKP